MPGSVPLSRYFHSYPVLIKSFGMGASSEKDAEIDVGLILPPDNLGSLPSRVYLIWMVFVLIVIPPPLGIDPPC